MTAKNSPFRFNEEEREDFLDLAYADNPIGDDGRIEDFILFMEGAVTRYRAYSQASETFPVEERKLLLSTKRTVNKLLDQLVRKDNALEILAKHSRNAYITIGLLPELDLLPIPQLDTLRAKLERQLLIIDAYIDLDFLMFKKGRKTRVPNAVFSLAMELVAGYYFHFGSMPAISNKKTPKDMPVLESPFTHFLKRVLVAIGQPERDTKYLTKRGIEKFNLLIFQINQPDPLTKHSVAFDFEKIFVQTCTRQLPYWTNIRGE